MKGDEILQYVDADDNCLHYISFDDAVEPELQGNSFILHNLFLTRQIMGFTKHFIY